MAFYRRNELQAIAQAKLDDAFILFNARRFSNAYYLAGYAVEIGLKACIAKQIVADVIPDKKFINDTYIHDLRILVKVAGLSGELKEKQGNDANFSANWAVVVEWEPEARYRGTDIHTTQVFLSAINDNASGVLPWIKMYW